MSEGAVQTERRRTWFSLRNPSPPRQHELPSEREEAQGVRVEGRAEEEAAER